MRITIKNILLFCALPLLVAACADDMDPQTKVVDKPKVKTAEYLQALRDYKKSDHAVAFGWFGGWNTEGTSMGTRLSSVPDSVDIISIWGRYWGLSEGQKEDLAYAQNVLGTQITYTIFAHTVPEPFEADSVGMQAYAKALADTMYKYNYDGIDLDYEPGFGGVGPLVGPASTYPNYKNLMADFVIALGKYFGPESKTGKLLLIDGVPYDVKPEIVKYFDYGIVQAYDSSGETDLQSRFNRALNNGWSANKYIFTEDFEKWWSTGGKANAVYINAEGVQVRVPSLEAMAYFKPTVDGARQQKGGCGTYHMENEYKHTPDYKYLRQAIQIMNPAK